MNFLKLNNEITDVVIEALQYFDHVDRKGMPQTFEETQASVSGAMDRYRNDTIFRAKAQMLVSRITEVVRANQTHSA